MVSWWHGKLTILRQGNRHINLATLDFLRRNLALAPRHTKEAVYKTLVRPQLEYAAPIWHSCNDSETDKVEKVQKGDNYKSMRADTLKFAKEIRLIMEKRRNSVFCG